MENSHSASYAAAGVDIEAGYKGVKLMSQHVARTVIPGVVSDLGGFGGLFAPDLTGMSEPVLVSGTDGVGTKQRIAQLLDKHDTVGIDCVAMCVNDIICCGAKPLFFLDYIAIGKNIPEKVATLVSGVAEGCVQAGCALIGGETGGGFYENLPRCLPEHLSAKIDKAAIQTPAIFRLLQSQGGIPERDMFNTYNMGVGMTVIVSKEDADRARSSLSAENCSAYVIGEITEGGERVNLC